ncbi:antibiotic biosynthesis monooxygenase [Parafrankia sp. FMc6]|uniref:antibiotic biosynthesis monooxygenase n=1 Tax=Parafrankia soli TaxID=2599596 RepID=UPI0034D6B29F
MTRVGGAGSNDSDGAAATVVMTLDVRDGCEREYRRWQERTNDAARDRPGFEAVELYPPASAESHSWIVVFRFSTLALLRGWLESPARRRLVEEGDRLLDHPATQEILAGRPPERDVVTAVVSHVVRRGHEREFETWQEKARRVQARSPGFLGYELFRPVPGVQEHWVALFRYDSMRHLEEWLDSAAREKLLADGRRHFAGFDVRTVGSSFSGWFRFGDGADGAPPPNWKQAMMVLLALYPTVMVLNVTVGRLLADLGLASYAVLFVGNVLSVSALTWLLMPLVNRLFAGWLRSGPRRSPRRDALGALVALGCYAAFIALFALTVG